MTAEGKARLYGRSAKASHKQTTADDEKPRSYESGSYKRYFEDYTVERYVDGGKVRIRRVYTGDYYVSSASAAQRNLMKLAIGVSFAAAVACFILAGASGRSDLLDIPLAILEMLNVIGLLLTGIVVPFCLTMRQKVTIGEYKTTLVSYRKRMKYLAVCCGLMTIVRILGFLISGMTGLGGLLWQLLYAVCVGALWFLGEHFTYAQQPRTAEKPQTPEAQETGEEGEEA